MGAAARPRVLSFLTPEKVPSMLTWVRPLFSLWHVHVGVRSPKFTVYPYNTPVPGLFVIPEAHLSQERPVKKQKRRSLL
jgi:hypothetical protein